MTSGSVGTGMTDQQQLRLMIEVASSGAEKVFATQGRICPMWHVIRGDREHVLIENPDDDQDSSCAMVREYLKSVDAHCVVFVAEAWSTTHSDGLTEAEEIIFIQAEDASGELVAHRAIIREMGKEARLGKLEIQPMSLISHGRTVGWLPRPQGVTLQ
jgi:hypothetical protein